MQINDEYDIEKALKSIEDDLVRSMIRNFDRHRAEELKEGMNWTAWQVEQLKALEMYKQRNLKKYKGTFGQINANIKTLIRLARQTGGASQEISILNAIKNGFKISKALKGSTQMNAEFFQVNDRKLNALVKATVSDMEKAEHAVLRHAEDQYRKIIFNAQVYANTGAGTYEKAVDMAAKDFLQAGINCIEYKNGSRHKISDYARMAIKTANKRAYLIGEGEKRQEWGVHTVIVNKRGNACPLCMPFVGKILIDDVYSGGSKADGNYPLLSAAIAAGLYHPNCRDIHTTYFPGISTPPEGVNKEDVEKAKEDYTNEQKQNYCAKNAERFRRMSENSLDPDNKRKYEARAKEWEEKERFYRKSAGEDKKHVQNDIKIFGKEFGKKKEETILENKANLFKEAKTLQEAKEYAFKELSVVINGAEDVPLDVVNSINKQYTQLIKKYPHMKGFIQDFDFSDVLETQTFAARKLSYSPSGRISRSILFNKSKYMDLSSLNNEYVSLVKSGHFPKGTTVEHILTHEFGHALSDDMALRMKKININSKFTREEWESIRVSGKVFCEIRIEDAAKKLGISEKQLQRKVSKYATESKTETFAEAFSSCNGRKPSKEALAIMKEYDKIKKIFLKGE